jgi:hypothetical protein
MKLIIPRLLGLLFLSALYYAANGQSPMPKPSGGDFPDHIGSFDIGSDFAKSERATRIANRSAPAVVPAYSEDRVIKEGPLAPSAEDQARLTDFLQTPDSGLIRLLPREGSFGQPAKVKIRGGGAYYSFARLTHEYGFGSDLELQQDNLSVGFAGADYGLMRALGDTPLEEVTLADPRVLFIATYTPPGPELAARAEGVRFRQGVTHEGAHYRSLFPVNLAPTFLLRSIVYDRSDVLVALRVIRKDDDGSIIIAWKLLQKYPKPILIRNQEN